MDKKITNNKIYFELLPESEQPVKSIYAPTGDMMKLGKVLDTGHKVEIAKKGDIIQIYFTTMILLNPKEAFCSDRDVIFVNDIPQKGKIHINKQSKESLSLLNSSIVINSNSDDIQKNDKIYYKKGQGHILPDNTEIISETQVYYKEG